ncbi:MAG: hypothetical protein RR454_03145 [Clostridia bacterium]
MLLENAVKIKNETQKTYEGLNNIVLHNYNVSKPTTVVGCMSLVSNLKLFKVYMGLTQPKSPKIGDIWIKANNLLLDNIKVNIVSNLFDNDIAIYEPNSLGILISTNMSAVKTLLNIPMLSLSIPISEVYLFDKNGKQIIDVKISIFNEMLNQFEVLPTSELQPIYLSRLMLSQIYNNIANTNIVPYLKITETMTSTPNPPTNKIIENISITNLYNNLVNYKYETIIVNEKIGASKNDVPIPLN